jgi:hypothetical protein
MNAMKTSQSRASSRATSTYEALITPPNTGGRPFLKVWIDFQATSLPEARRRAPDEARNFGGGGYSRVLKVRNKKPAQS